MIQYWRLSGLVHSGSLSDRLIVSLERGNCREALAMVDRLSATVRLFAIGRQLYSCGGPDLVREIRNRNCEVFLDLKFHDTVRAVCRSALEATRLGVKMFDLHARDRAEVMQRARHEVNKLCLSEGLRRPHMLAVAMVSGVASARDAAPDDNCAAVVNLARTAASAGLEGVVTSPQMVAAIRNCCGRRSIIVTSVARLRGNGDSYHAGGADAAPGAAEVIGAGADYVMAGSAVWNADDPNRAVRTLVHEMELGLRSGPRGALAMFSERPILN